MQAREDIKQETKHCEWCGKLLVLASPKFTGEKNRNTKAFDFYLDEMGRLVRDENELFLTSHEHKCKVTCSLCGRLVTNDRWGLFERNLNKDGSVFAEFRIPHSCRSA